MKWQLCVLGPGAVLGVSCSWIGTSTEIVRHVNVSQTVIKNIKITKMQAYNYCGNKQRIHRKHKPDDDWNYFIKLCVL